MEQLSANFNENVRWFNEVLGVGRSCDLVNRDLVIGGRRARIWVIDGFGGDAILERIGAFWLSISPEAVAGIDRMQAFVDRFVTFLEADVGTDPEEITTNVLLGKTLLLVEGIQGAALIDAKEYPGRSVQEPPDGQGAAGSARWLHRGHGPQYGPAAPPNPGPSSDHGGTQGGKPVPHGRGAVLSG